MTEWSGRGTRPGKRTTVTGASDRAARRVDGWLLLARTWGEESWTVTVNGPGQLPHRCSDGKYRGIPNLIHPEGNVHLGGLNSISRITAGPIKVTIHSETREGEWAGRWDIYPHCARFTVLPVGQPYWFLYEGTPGGKLDLDRDYWMRSNGVGLPVTESWSGKLPSPAWVYFGDETLRRVLFLLQHGDHDAPDQFWQMQGT